MAISLDLAQLSSSLIKRLSHCGDDMDYVEANLTHIKDFFAHNCVPCAAR